MSNDQAKPQTSRGRRYELIYPSPKEVHRMTCGICHEFCVKPVQIKRQYFCLDCAEQWMRAFKTYPGQSYSDTALIYPTYVPPKEAIQVVFDCDYKVNGCDESLTKIQFESHVKNCPFKPCEVYEKKIEPVAENRCSETTNSLLIDSSNGVQYHSKYLPNNTSIGSKSLMEIQSLCNLLTKEYIALLKENESLKKCSKIDVNDIVNHEVSTKLNEENIELKKEIEILRENQSIYSQFRTKLTEENRALTEVNIALKNDIDNMGVASHSVVKELTKDNKAFLEQIVALTKDNESLRLDKSIDSDINKQLSEENKALTQEIISLKSDNELLRAENSSKTSAISELKTTSESMITLIDGISYPRRF